MIRKLFLSAFFIGSAFEIVAGLFQWNALSIFFKPLIMVGLMGYYWLAASQRSVLFMVALLFCWGGDVFLLFQSKDSLYFMLGLGSFLTGHVLYVLSYQQHRWSEGVGLLGPQRVRFALPIVLAGTGLVVVLYPVLGGLKIPVMIYALVITVMALQALFRFGYTGNRSFALVFLGAVLFMISDSALAINKFLNAIPMAGTIIMATYCTAQFLIVQGILNHRSANRA